MPQVNVRKRKQEEKNIDKQNSIDQVPKKTSERSKAQSTQENGIEISTYVFIYQRK